MPHTNRKKKSATAAGEEKKAQPKLVHNKRQQIEDEDGWTHVIDTPRRVQVKVSEGLLLHAGDFEKDGVTYVSRTMSELRSDLEYYSQQWEAGEGCLALREKLAKGEEDRIGEEKAEKSERRRRVGNVVCLGLGSLQSARREGRRSSFTQLAALRTIIEGLGEDEKLQCIFQDPQFTDLDKEFLTSLGYSVVDDPLAFESITEKSLVFAIHCYAQVYKSVADSPRPAVIIGTDVENFGRFNLSETTESIAKSLEEMIEDCECIAFPQVRHDFSDTKIYWRRVEEEPATV